MDFCDSAGKAAKAAFERADAAFAKANNDVLEADNKVKKWRNDISAWQERLRARNRELEKKRKEMDTSCKSKCPKGESTTLRELIFSKINSLKVKFLQNNNFYVEYSSVQMIITER